MPQLKIRPEEDLKEEELRQVEQYLVLLGDYKERLVLESNKVFTERIKKLDKTLLTGLGDDMRQHLTKLRAKTIEDGESVYISKELTRINSDIVNAIVKRDELISRTR